MTQTKATSSAERLRLAREKAGFSSAAAAARHYSWGEAAYRHHENGTRAFGIDQAVAYARAFKVSASWLLAIADKLGTDRVPIAKFYAQVYAENLGEGSDIYKLIDDMFTKLGVAMFPELSVSANDIEWIVEANGLPPMHFIDPSELDVDADAVAQGYLFAYRVARRFPVSRLEAGNLVLIDSSVGDVGRHPAMYLFRDEIGPFIRAAQRLVTGDTLLIPDKAGGVMETFEDLEPIAMLGRVVWVGHRA